MGRDYRMARWVYNVVVGMYVDCRARLCWVHGKVAIPVKRRSVGPGVELVVYKRTGETAMWVQIWITECQTSSDSRNTSRSRVAPR